MSERQNPKTIRLFKPKVRICVFFVDWLGIFRRLEWRRKRIKDGITVTERDRIDAGYGLFESKDIDARNSRRVAQTLVMTDDLFVTLVIVIGCCQRSVRSLILFLNSGNRCALGRSKFSCENRFPVADCRAEKLDHQQKKPHRTEASQVSLSSDDFKYIRHFCR